MIYDPLLEGAPSSSFEASLLLLWKLLALLTKITCVQWVKLWNSIESCNVGICGTKYLKVNHQQYEFLVM